MSTFLDRLVGRARGAATVIEPVPVPLFAPEPTVGDEPAEPFMTGGESVVSGEREEPAVRDAAAPARRAVEAPSASPLERLMPPRASAAEPRTASVVPSAKSRAAEATNEPRSLPSTRVTVAPLVESPQNDVDDRGSDGAPPAVQPVAPPATSTAADAAGRAPARARGAVRPSRVQRPSAPSTPAPTAAATAEPPVVHVTIGRIDVRAATPAAPPPRRPQAARPTALSLEQYLAERDRGER